MMNTNTPAFGGVADPTSPAYLGMYNQMTPGDFTQTLKGAQDGDYAQLKGDSLYNGSGHFDPKLNTWVGITPRDATQGVTGKNATLEMMALMGGAGAGAALGGIGAAGAGDDATIGDSLMSGATNLPGGAAGGGGLWSKVARLGMNKMSSSMGGRAAPAQIMPPQNRMPQATSFLPINRPMSRQQMLAEEMSRGNA